MIGEIKGKEPPPLSDEEAAQKFTEACKLSELKYQQQRGIFALELGIGKVALDKLRKQELADIGVAGELVDSVDEMKSGIEPWPETVNGEELASQIHSILKKYCIMAEHSSVAVTLWVIAHYCIEHARIFPKLFIKSPEKRCGKTTLLEVLDSLCCKSMIASNVSTAVIFRVIEAYQCSLLLDEADTWIHGNEEMRGVINSGNTRCSAFVWRIEGDQLEPTRFSTFAPMVLSMIGDPPDTILDRSVFIKLRRKLASESVARLPIDIKHKHHATRQKLQRWADDNGPKIAEANPVLPPIENDRALDNYTPLAAVAEFLGGEWSEKLRQAIMASDTDSSDNSVNLKVTLLQDIQKVINDCDHPTKIFSGDLVVRLVALEGQPWAEINNGRELTQYKLSDMLKGYGIRPKQVRILGQSLKGYECSAFEDTFKRYVPPPSNETDTQETPKPNEVACGCMVSASESVSDHNETNVSTPNDTLWRSETKKPQQEGLASEVSRVSTMSETEKRINRARNF